MKLKTRLRAAERRQDIARLRAAQVMPMAGDGPAAQAAAAPLRDGYRGPDSYLGRVKGGWSSISLRPTREMLVAARYQDWLASRDALTISNAA